MNLRTKKVRIALSITALGLSFAMFQNLDAITMTSPNDTVVTNTSSVITDSLGNTFSLNSSKQIIVNKVTDTTTRNVIELAYSNSKVYQENTSSAWYSYSNGSWVNATKPSLTITPSPNGTTVTNTSGEITDSLGNTFKLTSGAQIIVNGTTNTTTRNVVELLYENSKHTKKILLQLGTFIQMAIGTRLQTP